ncbi:MAG TPA: hypothetical protein VIF09_18230 [Polyangiaceae bacterium]|jgi:hypothetical protein
MVHYTRWWLGAVPLVLLACTTYWDTPNPIFAADEWSEHGCEQHGGTCGGGLFGGCPLYGTWQVDDSYMCPPGDYFQVSCCLPTDGGLQGDGGDEEAALVDAGPAAVDASEDGSDGEAPPRSRHARREQPVGRAVRDFPFDAPSFPQ